MNVDTERHALPKSRIWAILLGPFVAFTAYLYFSRWPFDWANSATDIIVLLALVFGGAFGVARLPIRESARLMLAVTYLPLMVFILFFWAFGFLCMAFDLCL